MPPPSEDTWDAAPGLLHASRRYWWIVLLGMLVGAAAAYGLSGLQSTMYTATAEVLLASPGSTGVLGEELPEVDPQRHVQNQAQRMVSTAVLVATAELLGENAPDLETLRETIEVDASVETDVLSVNASAPTAAFAAETANAVTEAYENVLRQEARANADRTVEELDEVRDATQRRLNSVEDRIEADPDNAVLQRQADGLVAQLVELDNRSEQIAVNASLRGSGVEYVERAEIPLDPSQPQRKRAAAAGGVLGIAAGAAIAWMLDTRRRKADTRLDPAVVLSAPLLGSIPVLKSADGTIPTVHAPRSPAAEAYQLVVMSILASLPQGNSGAAILVTSAAPGDGKTITSLNLAVAAHHYEREVLLVDADTRMRGLTRQLDLSTKPGLSEFAEDADNLAWFEYRHDVADTGGLEVVPSGQEIADPAGFFRSTRFALAVQRMRDHADLVVIDSPPLLAVSDTLAVAQAVDGVVLVVPQGMSLDALAETRRRLAFVETPLLGYVFNRASDSAEPYSNYAYELPKQKPTRTWSQKQEDLEQ